MRGLDTKQTNHLLKVLLDEHRGRYGWIYILHDIPYGEYYYLYVGQTTRLIQRMKQHFSNVNTRTTYHTQLAYVEPCEVKNLSKREEELLQSDVYDLLEMIAECDKEMIYEINEVIFNGNLFSLKKCGGLSNKYRTGKKGNRGLFPRHPTP